jgi:L-lysine 2,3-aminomutase
MTNSTSASSEHQIDVAIVEPSKLNKNDCESSAAVHVRSNDISDVSAVDVADMMDVYHYHDETRQIIKDENLLPTGLLSRLQASYPQHSGLVDKESHMFTEKDQYTGLSGFREVVKVLETNHIDIGSIEERELFVEVYRFLATKHSLNSIDWTNFYEDSVFQLVMPQPNMINRETVDEYIGSSVVEKNTIVADYQEKTSPHDGNQQLNKPWFENEQGETEFLDGSQHKYPQCQLIFDKTTQNCFSFCTYCFRHAQVRGDEDMFIQKEIDQIHRYLKVHTEVTDMLITGGDGGYMPASRLEQYVTPLMEDRDLLHIKTVRLATRVLTFQPEMILSHKYDKMLAVFDKLHENGIQLAWMAHFSTPRELLNPSTIAAIRRLQRHGVVIRSQSPMMNHISLFENNDGSIDIDRSAKNWIDLSNILGTMLISFHSMYCARPTGEHHYFTAPLSDVSKIFDKIYRELPSINRPSRHLSMTTSAGKISIMGECEVGGERAFALMFTEGRNMKWMDKVFLAKYDESTNDVKLLKPFDTDKFFFEDELATIEYDLAKALTNRLKA